MPGLVAYNRRWDVGSDDFVFPAVIEIGARCFWLTVVVIVFAFHHDGLVSCQRGHLLQIYYAGMMVLLTLHILCNIVLALCSMRGAIFEVHKRRPVPIIIYVKAGLFFPELMWLGIGTYWAFTASQHCEFFIVATVKTAVVVGWVMFVALLIGIFVVFDPIGHKLRKTPAAIFQGGTYYMDLSSDGAASATQDLWEQRCKVICCSAAGDENSKNAFHDIAQLFRNFFEGLDLVPTDIAAGLILVRNEQQNSPRQVVREAMVSRSIQLAGGAVPQALVQRSHSMDLRLDDSQSSYTNSLGPQIPTRSISMPANQSQPLIDLMAANPSQPLIDVSPEASRGTVNNGNCLVGAEGSSLLTSYPTSQTGNGDTSHPNTSQQMLLSDESSALPWMDVKNATHFMKYAMASYGWPLYIYMNLPLGCCKLMQYCRCCQRSETSASVNQDNCCQCNTAAIHLLTGIAHAGDIVYASFYNAIYEIPFYVVLDHTHKAVVVSIRGTLSLRDALTDLTAENEDIPVEGVVAPCTAHKGILQAAQYVYSQLDTRDILTDAFSRAPGYQLVVTGHSLGAGAATLLSIMLKPAYPGLRCFAFSPPGGLLSRSLARYTQSFVCSVVLGSDLVPRLGLVSMEDLKGKVLRCVKDSSKPKYKILAGGVWNAMCGLPASGEGSSRESMTRQPLLELGRTSHLATPCYGSRDETDAEQRLEDAILTSGRSRMSHPPQYPPGHIIYIEEQQPASTCCGERQYSAAWAEPEVFSEILVSPRMVADHLPDAVFRALNQLNERNFRLSEKVQLRTSRVSLDEALLE